MFKERKGKPVSPNMLPAMLEKCSKKVKQYTIEGIYLKTWDSQASAERYIRGKTTGKISCAVNGLRPSAYGYIWRNTEDDFDKYPYIGKGFHPNSGQNRKKL